MRPCGGASFSQVSELMDVEAVFSLGVEALDHAGDLSGGIKSLLAEGDGSTYFGLLGVEDADGVAAGIRLGGAVEHEGRESEEGHEGK